MDELIVFAVGLLAYGLLRTDSHLAQVVVRAVVDVEIDIALDAWKTAHIGVLPELPRALILERVDIVMGYPVRILVEHGIGQIARLKFKIGIYNRFYTIVLFYKAKPLEYGVLELLVGLVLGLMLNVKHGRKVAILKVDGLDEVIGLLVGRCVNAVEMVGTTGKTILASLIEVVAEVTVGLCGSLGGLDHNETDGTMVYLTVILKLVPIDAALMVGDVDAVDLVAFGIAHIAVEGAPTEAEGADEEVVEEPDIARHDDTAANPPAPRGNLLEQTNKNVRTLMGDRPTASGRSAIDALSSSELISSSFLTCSIL